MFFFRAVRNHSHFKSESFDLEQAKQWLMDRDGERTSFYRVDDLEMANRVAIIYVMFGKLQPEQTSFVLIIDQIINQLVNEFDVTIHETPSDIAHRLLRETHREIGGLRSLEVREALARRIADHPGCLKERIHPKARTMGMLACREIDDPESGHEAASLIAGKIKWEQMIAEARRIPPPS